MISQYRPMLCGLTVIALAASLLPADAKVNEWTRFRGPDGTGVSDATTIPTQFDESDYNWKIELDGSGHSSPVCWDDRIFLSIVPADNPGSRELRCLSTADGSTIWSYTQAFEDYHNHKFNTSASTTPAVDADHIYFYSASAGEIILEAIDHDGKMAWNRRWKGFSMEHGQAASPILVGDTLVIANDQLEDGGGFVMGLDPKTGKTIWEKERRSGKAGYSTPGVFEAPRTRSGKQVVFFSMTHGVEGVDPDTGKTLWKQDPGFTFRSVGSPVYTAGVVFATVGAGGGGKDSVALDLRSNPEKPEILYRMARDIPYVPTPIAHDGKIYLWQDSGILRCIDARTGETVYEQRVGGNYFSSPILIGGNLWGMSREGRVVVVKAGDEFEILGENEVGAGVHATPAVHRGTLFIRTDTHLISLGGASRR